MGSKYELKTSKNTINQISEDQTKKTKRQTIISNLGPYQITSRSSKQFFKLNCVKSIYSLFDRVQIFILIFYFYNIIQASMLNEWQLKSRSLYIHVPIFKMKLYRSSNQPQQKPYLFIHLPQAKKITAFSQDLKSQIKTYKLNNRPNAFNIMNIDIENQERPYLICGSQNGNIQCQSLISYDNQLIQQSNQQINQHLSQNFVIKTQNPQQTYVNDLLLLGNNKVVNCYNNGTIAFWDILQKRRLHSLTKVHQNYTYKLRLIDDRLVSCGHDCQVVITDLIKMKKVTSFIHPDSVWCANPISYNVVSSVGLFNRVHIWDVRTKLLCQTSVLSHGESSFITKFDNNNLVLGDQNILKKCDLRTMRCIQFCSQNMLLSAENIIVTQKGGYACGRRFQVCKFQAVQNSDNNDLGITHFFNAYAQGKMYMYSRSAQQDQQQPQQQQQQPQPQQLQEQSALHLNVQIQYQNDLDQQQSWVDDNDQDNDLYQSQKSQQIPLEQDEIAIQQQKGQFLLLDDQSQLMKQQQQDYLKVRQQQIKFKSQQAGSNSIIDQSQQKQG